MAKYQGVAKIQLFNAETGQLEKEVVQHNMITNVISQVLNPPDYISAGLDPKTDYSRHLPYNFNPILDSFFNGVLIYNKTIPENKNITIAPFDNTQIGHAGLTTDNANQQIGTYNSNESGAITNGYRRVWDFGTDKANGSISCICLTSRPGGSKGETDAMGYAGGGINFVSQQSSSSPTTSYFLTRTIAAGAANYPAFHGSTFYSEKMSNGDIRFLVKAMDEPTIFEFIIGSPFKDGLYNRAAEILSINRVFSLPKLPDDYITFDWWNEGYQTNPGSDVAYNTIAERLGENDYANFHPYVYNNQIHIIYIEHERVAPYSIKHKVLDIDTYQEKGTTKTIPVPYRPHNNRVYSSRTVSVQGLGNQAEYYLSDSGWGTSQYNAMFCYDNHYFYNDDSNRLIIVNQDGSLFQIGATDFGIYGVYIDDVTNTCLVSRGNGTNNQYAYLSLVKKDTELNQYVTYAQYIPSPAGLDKLKQIVKVKQANLPFMFQAGWYYHTIAAMCATNWSFNWLYIFLSTINNLQSPVVKTNGQTMKITYDITQVSS